MSIIIGKLNEQDTTFKILLSGKDHLKWHRLIDYVKNESDIPQDLKLKLIDAYRYLDKALGQKFLNNCHKGSPKFAFYFLNKANWALQWVVDFANTHKIVKANNPEFDIVSRLNSKQKFHEGIVFLELYKIFCENDFLIEFETQIIVDNKTKSPDMKLFDRQNNEEVYIEISDLKMSDDISIENGGFHRLARIIQQQGVLYCGKISDFDESDFGYLSETIKTTALDCIKENKFSLINTPSLFLGISSTDSVEELRSWASQNNFSIGGLSGDPISFEYEKQRLKNKIQRKAKQLRPDSNNIIMIKPHPLFILGVDLSDVIFDIDKELYKYPKIMAVVLSVDYCHNNEEKTFRFFNHQISNKVVYGADRKTYVLIGNKHFTNHIDDSTVNKIYSSFTFGEISTLPDDIK